MHNQPTGSSEKIPFRSNISIHRLMRSIEIFLALMVNTILKNKIKKFRIISLAMVLALALPGAMAALTLNAATPAQVDICNPGKFIVYANNTGSAASNISINVTMPTGFTYDPGSVNITFPVFNNSTQAPVIFHQFLNWTNTSWTLDNNQILKIEFNLTAGCGAPSGNQLIVNAGYSGGVPTPFSSLAIIVNQGLLKVTKEPAVQFQGLVSWTIYIDNSGNETAKNVSVVDILGDGFFDVTSSNGTVTDNTPLANWTTINWSEQEVPVGVGTWSVVVNANSNETCGLTHINNVTVRGTCDTGCIYSNDSAIARALSQAVFRLDSLESLLRGQTDTISSFESLLKNTTLDANASREFLASFDDLSRRQQLGLHDFEGLVWCNWNDLEQGEKIKFTASFEDLLRRQAGIISSNDVLLIRGYCKLNSTEKDVFLSSYGDRIHSEQDLLNSFSKWLDSQSALNDTEQQTWYQFLASYEDLIRRQARLIGSFQELSYSSCLGTFMEVYKSTNKTDYSANAGEPINYTIIVNNTGSKEIVNITINDSILGVIQGSPGISLAVGTNKTYYKVVSHNCSYCSSCTCRICNFALACADVVMDASNRTHLCVASNEVCMNITQPNLSPVYPG